MTRPSDRAKSVLGFNVDTSKPNTNKWRQNKAARASFLIDGEAYFKALYESLIQAQSQILIAGWDVSAGIELVKDFQTNAFPVRLGPLLYHLVDQNPDLEVRVLCWNFPFLYSSERESVRRHNTDWKPHKRLSFVFDSEHPIGASHHQKIVVVDDRIAYCGGLDLCNRRWDSPAHRPDDPRRIDSQGKKYGPFHDVQMLVEGPVAKDLGDLFRIRWQQAKAKPISPAGVSQTSPWPESVRADISDAAVAVSLTEPDYKKNKGCRQIEMLTVAAIKKAKDYIYIENQFLSSDTVGRAIIESLQEIAGPEIVIILPYKSVALLEELTIGFLQNRLVRRIMKRDRFRRLGIFYPHAAGLNRFMRIGSGITVHSKVMIVDSEFVKVGSANLNNRSMGLDTECDLSIEASGDLTVQKAIQHFRDRLLAEHLGSTTEKIASDCQANGLLASIRAHRHQDRNLRALHKRTPLPLIPWIPKLKIFDPSGPIATESVVDSFMAEETGEKRPAVFFQSLSILLTGLAFVSVWENLPILDFRPELIHLRESYLAAGIVFALGGIFLIPSFIFNLIAFTLWGPVLGFLITMVGSLVTSSMTYLEGRLLPRNYVRRLAGNRINSLGRRMARMGVIPNIVLRMLPIAPISVLNLISGAEHINFRHFLRASLLSMLPSILIFCAGQSVFEFIYKNQGKGPALISMSVFCLIFLLWTLRPRNKAHKIL